MESQQAYRQYLRHCTTSCTAMRLANTCPMFLWTTTAFLQGLTFVNESGNGNTVRAKGVGA
jgi:hypothetical protein